MSDDAAMAIEAMLDAFAEIEAEPPVAALTQAAESWPEVGDRILDILRAVAGGSDGSDRAMGIAYYAIYLAAHRRDTRVFPLLCEAARNGVLEEILQDDLLTDLDAVFSRTVGDDVAGLKALVEDETVFEAIREIAVLTIAELTRQGRLDRAGTEHYLGGLADTLRPRKESLVWFGWSDAIALLGLTSLQAAVERIVDQGWMGEPRHLFLDEFRIELEAAQARSAEDLVLEHDEGGMDDIAAFFGPREESDADEFLDDPDEEWDGEDDDGSVQVWDSETQGTYHNPHRNIGRNDPCPCGSGRKFKKCCMETAA